MGKICLKHGAILVTLLLLCIVSGCPQFDYIDIGLDRYWEPDDMAIDFESDKEIDLSLEVKVACTHEVGIGFASNDLGSDMVRDEKIRGFFGTISSGLNLPAEIDIKIINKNNQVIYENAHFGGPGLHWSYGPNPIRFLSEWIFLKQGTYHIKIIVKKRDKDFSEFSSFFFASHRPKIFCGK